MFSTRFLLIISLVIYNLTISAQCWDSVATGTQHTIAIKADGTLWAWGHNAFGQLGDETTEDKSIPIQIGNSNDWLEISAEGASSFALKTDGTLWAWGSNLSGELGIEQLISYVPMPTQVGTENNWFNIEAGYSYTLALKTDGTLWSWGANYSGQLGDGTNISQNSPIQIGLDTWSVISANHHSLAIKTDGTLWAWGTNEYGQVGDGSFFDKFNPVLIGGESNWIQVSCGRSHSLALDGNGSIWTWGLNSYGQLGNGNTDLNPLPALVDNSRVWVNLSAGWFHNFAITDNGNLYAWGNSSNGQLGNEEIGNFIEIIPIGTNTWSSVSGGQAFSAAIKQDGTLWAWGQNSRGQLGTGDEDNANTPNQILTLPEALPVSNPGSNYYLQCGSPTIILDGNLSQNASVFSWTTNDGNIVSGANTATPSVDEPGIYFLEITAPGGCTDLSEVQVFESLDAPDISVNGGEINCNNNNTVLQVTSSVENLVYEWSGPGINESNENSPSPEVNTPGLYSVVITNPINGCTNSAITNIISDFSLPAATITSTTGAFILECNQPISLDGSNSTEVSSFQWTNENDEVIGISQSLMISQVGIYTLEVTGDNGCTDLTEVFITGTTFPSAVELEIEAISCQNKNDGMIRIMSIEGGIPPFTYLLNDGVFQEDDFFGNLGPGLYSLTVKDANGCIYTTENIDITEPIENLEVKIITPASGAIAIGATFNLQFWSNEPLENLSVLWNGDNLSCNTCFDPIISLEQESNYEIRVTNLTGCTAFDSTIIYAKTSTSDESHVITPGNQNGENDRLVFEQLQNGAYPDNKLTIFNRLGSTVYQVESYDNNWGGRNEQGEELPHGTYFFVLFFDKNSRDSVKGDVLLIR